MAAASEPALGPDGARSETTAAGPPVAPATIETSPVKRAGRRRLGPAALALVLVGGAATVGYVGITSIQANGGRSDATLADVAPALDSRVESGNALTRPIIDARTVTTEINENAGDEELLGQLGLDPTTGAAPTGTPDGHRRTWTSVTGEVSTIELDTPVALEQLLDPLAPPFASYALSDVPDGTRYLSASIDDVAFATSQPEMRTAWLAGLGIPATGATDVAEWMITVEGEVATDGHTMQSFTVTTATGRLVYSTDETDSP